MKKSSRFRTKILWYFILSMVLVFCVAGYGSYELVFRAMAQDVETLGAISASQINMSINIYIDELNRLSSLALSDAEFTKAVKNMEKATTLSQNVNANDTIRQFMYNLYNYRTDMYSVTMQMPSGRYFYVQQYTRCVVDGDAKDYAPWFQEMMENVSDHFRIIGHRVSSPPLGGADSEEVFSVARRIVDNAGRFLCILVLDVKYDTFLRILQEAEKARSANVFLQDDKMNLLYQTQTGVGTPDGRMPEINEQEYFVIANRSQQTGWTVTMAIPRAQMFGSITNVFKSILCLLAFAFVCGVALYSVVTISLTKPVHVLAREMKRVEEGDFSVSITPSSHDEIGELTVGFNHMTAQMGELLNKMVQMEIRDKESEYMVLQSQINPHFLYNTLETIRMRCVIQKQYEIAEVINTLGNLFRLTINHRERFVPLREEIEHVNAYIAIQNFRFDNKYRFAVHAQEGALDFMTLKLMMQPLVENCVFHGLEAKPNGGSIDLTAAMENGDIRIVIADDGVGIPEDKLRELRDFLEHPTAYPDKRSLGLRNVHERIQLFFGKKYGLNISSKENEGTVIVITMPAFLDEDEVKLHL